ncbi:MAG: hypothetical protein R3C19_09005 [Planctomycetaceae bacterium]
MFNRVQMHPCLSNDLSFLTPQLGVDSLPLELQELIDLQTDSPEILAEESAAAESDWPVSIFIPERYEENYSYPLVIWFHEAGGNEDDIETVMHSISPQNYCGLALRGNRRMSGRDSFEWNHDSLSFGEVPLARLVNITTRRLRRAFHIHSERIFVAGAQAGADVALQLLLQHSDWFAGAILLDPTCDPEHMHGVFPGDLRGKHVLQTVSRNASNETLARNVEAVRLLRSAGVKLDVRMSESPLNPYGPDVRFIDHWLLSRISQAAFV